MNSLVKANLVLLALLVAHTIDHALNQPTRELPATSTLVGLAGFAIVGASAVLAVRGHRLAAPASLAAGIATAAGLVVIHIVPDWWREVSDPYADFGANGLSWLLLVTPLAAALWLAAVAGKATAVQDRTGTSARAQSKR